MINAEASRLASLWTRSLDGAEVLDRLSEISDRRDALAVYGATRALLSPIHAEELAEAWAQRLAA